MLRRKVPTTCACPSANPGEAASPASRGRRIFVGVIAPIDPRIETAEEVRDRVLEASEYIPVEQLGTTDDCGFSPFFDNGATSRDTAFAKIRARVHGTAMAAELIGGRA